MTTKDVITSVVTMKKETTEGMTYYSTEVDQTSTMNACSTLSCSREFVTGVRELDIKNKPPGTPAFPVKAPLQRARHKPVTVPLPTTLRGVSSTTTLEDTLHAVEVGVVAEVNRVRLQPMVFANDVLKPQLARYTGRLLQTPTTWLMTKEGVAATTAGIQALEEYAATFPSSDGSGLAADVRSVTSAATTGPPETEVELPPELVLSRGLTLAARDLALDIGQKGLASHRPTDDSTLFQRLKRYGTLLGCAHQLVSYGLQTPAEMVAQLLVDDGLAARPHRKMLLDSRVSQIGVCYANHSAHGYVTVLVLAAGFEENSVIEQCAVHEAACKKASLKTAYSADSEEEEADSKTVTSLADARGRAKCAACFSVVEERVSVFAVNGQRFHRHCLVCKLCKSSLRSLSYVDPPTGETFCGDCMKFRNTPRCTKCFKWLREQPIHRVKGIAHCPSCFDEATTLVQSPCALDPEAQANEQKY